MLWKREQNMSCDKNSMLLYAVTDRAWTGERTLYQQVEQALRGGATCVQLREKELNYDDFLKEALELRALCKSFGVPFIVNDNVDIALACGADGVHVGQHDMQARSVRERIGNGMLLGVSAQTVEQAREAERNGADYLGVGAVFATSTKPDADFVSREELIKICKAVSIPVVAIGGISRENMLQLKSTGIDGVALVSAIFAAEDIESECRALKKRSERIVASNDALRSIKGAVFDLDGTLLDSMYVWDNICFDYLLNRGITPRAGLAEKFHTLSLKQSAEYYQSEYGITDSVDVIMDDINAMVEKRYFSEVLPKDGVCGFLELLREKGVKMCVATATDRHLVEAALERNGILHYFSDIFTCTGIGHGKDEPNIYNAACEHLGTPKGETAVFEDAFYAAKTAKDADFVLAAVYDRHEKEHQKELFEIADAYIVSFNEMRDFLD